jgi:hypothetical protein
MQLSHAKLVPVPAGQGSNCSTWSWSPSGPDGRSLRGGGPVVPRVAGAQQGLRGGGLGGQVSRWCMDLAWPERRGSCHAWVWHGAVALHSLRGREPGRMEQ